MERKRELTTNQKQRQLTVSMLSLSSVSPAFLYHCLEKQINRKRKDFRDVNAKENIDKLNQELMDVSKIMTESFDMLLNRDRNLN